MPLARRAWNLPLGVHAAVLAGVLFVLVAVVGTDAVFFSDEGAGLAQAELVADGEWTLPNPLPAVDPDGEHFPLAVSDGTDDGFAPLGKHPAYPAVLAPVVAVAGQGGAMVVSVLGTVVASLAAASLARRLRPGAARGALWLTGLGSPLAVDGLLVAAHTLAAAAAAGGLVLALSSGERRSWPRGALVFGVLLLPGLLRTEGVFLVAAIGTGLGVAGLLRRDRRLVGLGAAAVVAGGASRVLDGLLSDVVLGPIISLGGAGFTQPWSGIEGRFLATWTTLFRPGYDEIDLAAAVVFLGAGLLATAAVVVRRRPADSQGILLFAALGVAAVLARVVLGPPLPISGLAIVFPAGLAGLLLVGRAETVSDTGRALAVAGIVFALAVAATQYPAGGGTEWGGRYFAAGLPLATPLAAAALARHRERLAGRVAGLAGGALAVATAGVLTLGVLAVRNEHDVHRGLVAAIEDARGATPVVVSADPRVPRFAWRVVDDASWQLVLSDDLAVYTARLATGGVDEWLLVLPRSDLATAEVSDAYEVVRQTAYEVEHATRATRWELVTYRRSNT